MSERITGKTQLLGLLATPISHSLSPAIYNEACAYLDLDYVYLAFDCGLESLEAVIAGFRALKVRGFNVSMPNKSIVHKYLDKVTPTAELMGAINVVVNEDGVLVGYNMDGQGYMRALAEEGVDVVGKKVTIIGAGGAAKSIGIQAALDGAAELSIFNRRDASYSEGEKLVSDICNSTKCRARMFDLTDNETLRAEISDSDLLANSTSVGQSPNIYSCVIADPIMLRADLFVSDVIYSPRKTKLLQMAESRGCRTMNGLGMLLWQGAEGFKLWTGHELPVDYIKQLIF